MDPVPLFLNEKSYPMELAGRELLECVVKMLGGILRAKQISGDIVLASTEPLATLGLTVTYDTFAAVLRADRDWWRFMNALRQRSPFSNAPACLAPESGRHVVPASTQAREAALWAITNNAFMVSFPSAVEWRSPQVLVGTCRCLDDVHASPTEISTRNISNREHADAWSDELTSYAHVAAASAVVYEGLEFVLKMYLKDHGPPHVHVFFAEDRATCVAKVRFDVGPEVLKSTLESRWRKKLLALIEPFKDQLMAGWERASVGQRPHMLVVRS